MSEMTRELESVRVARVLREEIVQGIRPPGSRLVERDIAAELHVSRLPVREAIRQLVQEGIVLSRPRTWAVVREFTSVDVRSFAEVREVIETLAFVFAAERHEAEDLLALRAILDKEAAACAVGDAAAAYAASDEFHESVVRIAGNEVLSETIRVFLTRARWLFGKHDDLEQVRDEHGEIMEAIVARDVVTLRRLVPRHLDADHQRAQRLLQEQRPASSAS